MSVINQMLKDLDKRQNEQQGAANATASMPKKSSTNTLLFIIVAIIILNVVGILGWQLYSENQQLKSQVSQEVITFRTEKNTDKSSVNEEHKLAREELVTPTIAIDPNITTDNSSVATKALKPVLSDTFVKGSDTVKADLAEMTENKHLVTKPVMHNSAVSLVTPIAAEKDVVKPIPVVKNIATKPTLTISRSQLSPQALAENKITEAEQAIERNDIVKAEALFEEVLLVMPEHETARKQLAALWYGKKSYQDAVNLLSQGIALAPQAQEMRLMSARIYYEQGQARQAYNILSPVKHNADVELQALLANLAAEINEHDAAIIAYAKLIALEPNVGRWYLGSAVSLDSLGKFERAREAYKQAIALNNLSSSAMQFARQRLIELGE
ncbi:MAG: tetratricopeptide repeat protein [Cognaticolwellia sp.]